jgi:hypothetical protein
VHVESGAAPGVGVPGALGKQTHRRRRSGGARSRADESAERARLADVARLSVACHEGGALNVFQGRRLPLDQVQSQSFQTCDEIVTGNYGRVTKPVDQEQNHEN